MTPKIERFLDERQYPTPFLAVDLERVAVTYSDIRRMLPVAEIYYAVKANPAPQVLRTLCELGSCFDAASVAEVELCLAAGSAPERISYGNVVKKEAEIAALRNKIAQLKEEIHKSELKLQKEKSEGSGFLGKVRDKLIGPAKTIKPAEVIEPEVLTDSEEES